VYRLNNKCGIDREKRHRPMGERSKTYGYDYSGAKKTKIESPNAANVGLELGTCYQDLPFCANERPISRHATQYRLSVFVILSNFSVYFIFVPLLFPAGLNKLCWWLSASCVSSF
jgi:hypothetical protein